MYSVILMAAMTTPADAPAFGKLFKGGCAGCAGSACTGCSGLACAGGSGWSCGGCSGIAYDPYAAHAGYGWAGYSCGGCCGGGKFLGIKNGCWGTGGFRTFYSCHGAGACFGYAYAGAGYGFAGCYGSCYGSYTNYFSYWSTPAFGSPVAPPVVEPAGTVTPPSINVSPATGTGSGTPANPANPPKAQYGPAPAAVVVTLPADARLFANGQPTRQTSGERRFVTPELRPGRTYRYVLTAEITRDDRPITETIEVDVRPGAESRATFGKLIAATAAEPTRVASN